MRAVIYARYSTGKEQTGQSIEGQVRVCSSYIEAREWELTKVYADEHISGKTDKRPQFQAMVNDAERRLFDVLVVYSSDRFSRNKVHAVTYKQRLKDLGIKICYAAENIPDGPEGLLLESIMEGWAQYYSDELSRKVKRGMNESALKCKSNGSHRTFGYYTGPDKTLLINEEEAPAVRQIYKQIAEGGTIAGCVRWLNGHGYRSTLGREFKINAVRHMLSNKRYIGYYKFDQVEIPDGVPAIIDKTLFYDVQEKLSQNKRFMPKNRVDFLLTGKLYCGKCGEPMTGVSGHSRNGDKYSYYRCRSRDVRPVPKIPLEDQVAEYTAEFFQSDREELLEVLYYYIAKKSVPEGEYGLPKKKLSDLKRKKENLIEVIADTGNRALVARLEETESQIKAIEDQIAEAERHKVFRKLTKEELGILLDNFLDRLGSEDFDKSNKRLIDVFVKDVVLYEDDMLITFNVPIINEDPESFKEIRGPVFADYNNWWCSRTPGRTTGVICGLPCIIRKKAGA